MGANGNINDLELAKFMSLAGETGIRVHLFHGDSWLPSVADFASLPAIGNTNGDIRQLLDTGIPYRWDGSNWSVWAVSSNVATVGFAGSGASYICDGTADNVQIQAAIDYLESQGGGKLIIKEGNYSIAAGITVLSDNITIEGVGAKTLLTLVNGVNDNVIRVGDVNGGTFYENILIRDIYIEGNKANQAQIGAIYPSGIQFEKCNMSVVDNVIAHNCWSVGVGFTYGSKNKVINCTLNDHGYDGIGINESYETLIVNNCCAGSGHAGLILKNTNNCTVTGNQFSYNSGGIAVNYSKYCTITGNDCSHGSASSGIGLIGLEGSAVTGNICRKNAYDGIRMDGCRGNTISGNQCTGNSQITTNTYSGISLIQNIAVVGCTDNVITGNNCGDNQYPDPETQKYGITENNAGEGNNRNMYSFNVCRTNVTGSMDLYGANNMDVSNWDSLLSPYLYSMEGLGVGTKKPTQIISLGGDTVRKIWMERHTTANTAGNNLTIEAGGATIGATNKAGGSLLLRSGVSTGSARGAILLETSVGPGAGTGEGSFVSNGVIFGGTTAPVFALGGSASYSNQVDGNGIYVLGTGVGVFGMIRQTTANTAGNALTVRASGATSGATDKNGGTLKISSGTSTGTGSGSVEFLTATPQGSTNTTDNAPSVKATLLGNGNFGIGQATPTATLHLKAGTATAGTAPIKLTAGTNLTTPENGTLEFDGTNLFFTVGGTRKTVTLV